MCYSHTTTTIIPVYSISTTSSINTTVVCSKAHFCKAKHLFMRCHWETYHACQVAQDFLGAPNSCNSSCRATWSWHPNSWLKMSIIVHHRADESQ